jgi:glycosyltransferase involved in cell wall biosynthesis
MKILLVSSITPPIGGIGVWTETYLDSKFAKKHNVVFINESIGISNSKFKKLILSFKNFFRIKHELKNNFDVIHINTGGSVKGLQRDAVFALLCSKKKNKVLVQIHCDASYFYNNKTSIKLLRKMYANKCKFLVINKPSALFLDKILGPDSYFLVDNFVSNKKAYRVEVKESVDNVIFVGHITKEKGVDLIYRLAEQYKNITFSFLGRDLGDLPKQNLDNVKYLGEVQPSEVVEEMKKHDLLLLPSQHEGLPLVILESMSIGLPIISSNVGDIPRVLEGTNSIVFDINQPETFPSNFDFFINDFARRKENSQLLIKKFYNCFETEKVLEIIEKIYNS